MAAAPGMLWARCMQWLLWKTVVSLSACFVTRCKDRHNLRFGVLVAAIYFVFACIFLYGKRSSPVQSTVVPCTEYGRPLYGGRLSQVQVIVWEYKRLIIKGRLFRMMSVWKIVDFSRIIWYLGYKLSMVYTQPPVLPAHCGWPCGTKTPSASLVPLSGGTVHAARSPYSAIHYSLLIIHYYKIHY